MIEADLGLMQGTWLPRVALAPAQETQGGSDRTRVTPSHLHLSENGYYPCSLGLSYVTKPITPLSLFKAPHQLHS